MSVNIDEDAEISSVRLDHQTGAPTPDAGYSHVFAKADGLYVVDDYQNVTGPMEGAADYYDPDRPPDSPSSYDDEFNDKQIDSKWGSTTQTDVVWFETATTARRNENQMPGRMLLQSTTMSQAFTPSLATPWTLVAKASLSYDTLVNETWWYLQVTGQTSNYAYQPRIGRYNGLQDSVRVIYVNGGSWAVALDLVYFSIHKYLMIVHNGAKSFRTYVSHDGIGWMHIEETTLSGLTSFTNLIIGTAQTGTYKPILAIDYIRYFTPRTLMVGRDVS